MWRVRCMNFQCLGGPGWLGSDLYDVEAKPDSDRRAVTEAELERTRGCAGPDDAGAAGRPAEAKGALRDQRDDYLCAGGCEGWPEDAGERSQATSTRTV